MELEWNQGELREGRRCYEAGAFFEAHEHWELVWLAATEPEKTFLQGLIQVAAALHHLQRGNRAGTISLLQSALRRLDGYADCFGGVEVVPLREAIQQWVRALEADPPLPLPALPRLELTPSE